MLCWPLLSSDVQACSPGLPILHLSRRSMQVQHCPHGKLQCGHGCLCCALQVAAGWTALRYSLQPSISGMPAGSSVLASKTTANTEVRLIRSPAQQMFACAQPLLCVGVFVECNQHQDVAVALC